MRQVLSIVLSALWAMLPAYVPNNAAVLAGGGKPIDGGRSWCSARLLGDGKTWRGTAIGIASGVAVAVLLNGLARIVRSVTGFSPPRFDRAALTLPTGAMLGDMAASFYKRRSGRERGAPVPVLDQLDFVCGALALTELLAPAWSRRVFRIPVLGAVFVLTPLLHLATNAFAYLLGWKDEPY